MRKFLLALLLVPALAALGFGACSSPAPGGPGGGQSEAGGPDGPSGVPDGGLFDAGPRGTADIVLLALSDLRGQVEPLVEVDTKLLPRAYGGLPALVSYLGKERDSGAATLVLSVGDSFGPAPLVVQATDGELAARGLALLSPAAISFGPHDFDRGTSRLEELLEAGTLRAVSSNLDRVAEALGPRPVTPFALLEVGDPARPVRVAVIGLVDADLATLQFSTNLGSLTPVDAGLVQVANDVAKSARLVGADVVIALAHQGAVLDDAGTPSGPLVDLAKQLNGVDVLFGGETDIAFARDIGGVRVVESRSRGRTFARVTLHVERGVPTVTGAEIREPVLFAVARVVCDGGTSCSCATGTCPDAAFACDEDSGVCSAPLVTPDRAALDLVDAASATVPRFLDSPLGDAGAAFDRDGGAERMQETALGDLVADALRDRYGAQIALFPGSQLLGPLPSSYVPSGGRAAPLQLVMADVMSLLPDELLAVVRTVKGRDLWTILEHAVENAPSASDAFLQVSGIAVSYSLGADAGGRIKSITLVAGAQPILKNDTTDYTVVVPETMSNGAFGFSMLKQPIPTPPREVLTQVVADYVRAKAVIAPAPSGTRLVPAP